MKKLSDKQKNRCARNARKGMRARVRAASALRRARSRQQTISTERITSVSILVPVYVRYYADKKQRNAFGEFLDHVEYCLSKGKNVSLNFSETKRLFPCGVLIVMGMVDHWTEKFPNRLTANYPADDLAEQMLQHVGVLQKLGLPPRKKISHNDVTRWHYFTGQNVDATTIEPFMEQVRSLVGEEAQMGLADCVNEAMTNVRHHAYSDDAGGRWWIFATISERRVFVAMHDRGASIPVTLLEKPEIWDYLTGRMWQQGRGDGRLISAAADGRTSTKLPYRGKGLPEMLQFTKASSNGELAIYSRRGFFRFSGRENMESIGKLTKPIAGTLIVWMLNFSGTTP
ncbi:MAG: ATP-binding protein [Polaromonas sp.]|nr:ATP-binding protein [Polaromonas sp.]